MGVYPVKCQWCGCVIVPPDSRKLDWSCLPEILRATDETRNKHGLTKIPSHPCSIRVSSVADLFSLFFSFSRSDLPQWNPYSLHGSRRASDRRRLAWTSATNSFFLRS